jgi:hypothetical protein
MSTILGMIFLNNLTRKNKNEKYIMKYVKIHESKEHIILENYYG